MRKEGSATSRAGEKRRPLNPLRANVITVGPWILFATLGGIMDGKCIYCTDRSVGATTLLVSWTLLCHN
jgi:hypothetical protein